MIVDCHSHIFPPLAGTADHPISAEHLFFLQLYVGTHAEPDRRLRDHAVVPEADRVLHDGRLDGPDGILRQPRFRVGRFGRFEWDFEGEAHYRSFLPPSLQGMVSPPEFILQQMARAGVDVAVLQNARPYGRLNAYIGEAIHRYPDRFIGLADVKEAEAHTEAERSELTRAVREYGLRGLYYANRGLIFDRYRHGFDDPLFDPFWERVRSLGVPVFWEILGVPMHSSTTYLGELDRLSRWCERYPDVSGVLTHGLAPEYLEGALPEPVARLLRREQLMVEVLYPIHWGRNHDYPYPELRPALGRLYDLVGPERLVWGSDMPNVERNCTYRQSLEYLRQGLAGIATPRELDQILGRNVLRLLGAPSAGAA